MRGEPGQLLALHVLVEIDLERDLVAAGAGGSQVRAVPLVAHRDVAERPVIDLQRGVDVVELDALPRRDAVAASGRAEEPAAAESKPAARPCRGCIARQASADIDRCAFQTFVGEKKSAALIEVMFVGGDVLAGRRRSGAEQARSPRRQRGWVG